MRSLLDSWLSPQKRLFFILISLDIVVVLIHILFGRQNNFFHLDFEQNFPTIFQSGKLILFGLFIFLLTIMRKVRENMKAFLIPLSLVTIFLGFDELLQIHENIYRIFEFTDLLHPSRMIEASMRLGYRSSLWILYYLPFMLIFVFWSGYWMRYFQSKIKDHAWILILSSASVFAVIVAEVLSTTGSFSDNTYFWLVTVEEAAEMVFASTLAFVGMKILNKYSK